MKNDPPKPPKSKQKTEKSELTNVIKALGLDQLGLGDEVDINKLLELTEVVTDYLTASEDKNEKLKLLKKK